MTIKDIAREAGVSIGTVDRVLHKRGRVAEETRARIQEIMDRGSYQANPLARHLKRGRGYEFLVLMPRRADDQAYWELARQGIARASKELQAFGVRVTVREFRRDRSAKTLFDRLDFDDFDGLLLAPVETGSLGELGGLLASLPLDLPLVFFDADLASSRPLCRIAQEPRQAGTLAGRIVSMLCPQAQRLGVLIPHAGDLHLRHRAFGFRDWFEVSGGHSPVDIQILEAQATEHALADLAVRAHHLECQGWYICNSAASVLLPMLEATENWKPGARPVLVAHDLTAENHRLLAADRLDCLISQNPGFQAWQGIMSLYRSVVLGSPPPQRILAPLDIHFKENLPAPGALQGDFSV